MTIWIMEPRDPLLVRDGRPFGPDPGARATSLPFPFPSTLAGGIRARAGSNEDGIFQYVGDKAALQRLKTLRIRGPLLVQLTADGGDIDPDTWLLPAPHDAQLLPTHETELDSTTAYLRRLVPLAALSGALTDLDQRELWFVGDPGSNAQSKPLKTAPAFWYWQPMKNWLLDPALLTGAVQTLSQLGLRKLESERRLHVSIDAAKETAKEGMLFETSGLEFTAPGNGKQRLHDARRLALVIAAEDGAYTVHSGLTSFGGERRLVTWRKSSVELPACPEEVAKEIIASGHCRVCLLTPAYFAQGYRPKWLLEEHYGVTATLRAMAVQRPQVVSGWDLEIGKPKPSRRLAPAGTVLFLSLKGTAEARREWVRNMWMQCISDDEMAARTDGFGLAVLGTWDGQAVPIERGATQ